MTNRADEIPTLVDFPAIILPPTAPETVYPCRAAGRHDNDRPTVEIPAITDTELLRS